MPGTHRFISAAVLAAAVLVAERPATAADTVETWDSGATDVDLYFGFDGIGLGRYEKGVYGDLMFGYGLIERLSAYLGATLNGNEYFSDSSADIYLGIFGTPVETNHLDVDLFLDFSAGGPARQGFQVAPALELNVDLDPEMRTWGTYVRAAFPIIIREESPREGRDTLEHEAALFIESVIGTYFTVAGRHQLLLEYDMVFHPRAGEDENTAEIGGLALGYNVVLSDAIEMINQVYVDIPQDGEDVSVGIMTGIIATIPSTQTAAMSTRKVTKEYK